MKSLYDKDQSNSFEQNFEAKSELPHSSSAHRGKTTIAKSILLGLSGTFVILIGNAIISYRNTLNLVDNERWVTDTHQVLDALKDVVLDLKDAETGQSSYVITGQDEYLEPYQTTTAQVEQDLQNLQRLTADNPKQIQRIAELKTLISPQLAEFQQTIQLRRNQGFTSAQRIVLTNQGKQLMKQIDQQVATIEGEEMQLLVQRSRTSKASVQGTLLTLTLFVLINLLFLGIVYHLIRRDSQKRQRVVSELQTQRQMLETIVNYLPSSVAIVRGHDLTFQLVNPAYQALAPDKDMMGKTIGEVWTEMQPVFTERCRHVLETGEPYSAIDEAFKINRTANEPLELVYFSWSMHRIDLPNQDGWGILLTIEETTDRKHSEVKLSQMLQKLNFHIENSPLAVVEWDQDFRVSRWSSDAERIFGWRAEEVLGKAFSEWKFVFDEDLEQVQRMGQRLAQGIEQRSVVYNRNYTKSGEIVHCEWYNSMLVDASGQLVSVLSLALDVSPRVRLEQERDNSLKQEQVAREQAEQANRIKDEFLAVLSHEIRTPLNPILGWSKLLRARKLSPQKAQEAFEIIERNAQLQTQLIEDLLDISRILRGKMALNMLPVDLVSIVSAALDTIALSAENKQIELQLNLTAVGQISGDAARLQQVVWNLLSNAIKFTPKGGHVEIRLTRNQNRAKLEVIDAGKGIEPSFLPYVFETFRQENGATTRKFGGLGLGLAIVKQLVELHGGTITATSAGVDQGATFTLELPILLQSHQPIQKQFLQEVADTSRLSELKILVVDDESDSRDIVTFLLEQAGATVASYTTATEALQALTRSPFDFLVSDVGMPEMDGYMLMRQVRMSTLAINRSIRAIALTAYAGDFDQQQALLAGFQRHLSKPIDPDKLLETLLELMDESVES